MWFPLFEFGGLQHSSIRWTVARREHLTLPVTLRCPPSFLGGPRRATAPIGPQGSKPHQRGRSSFEARAKRREHLRMTVIDLSVTQKRPTIDYDTPGSP